MQRLRAWAGAERSKLFEVAFVAVATAVSFVTRYELEGTLPPGFPYLTFFPAVILTGFFASTRAGIAVAFLCGLASWYFFIAPVNSWALHPASVLALTFYIFICATDLLLIHVMRLSLNKLTEEKERSLELAQANKLMFHELQHRVSNNLQVISSLLKMQQRNLADPNAKKALEIASARLQVISSIQRKLHNPKRQIADVKTLFEDLLPEVLASSEAKDRVKLTFDLEEVTIDGSQATPVALIIVELLSNTFEHAAGPDQNINVTVSAHKIGNEIVMTVADDGKGLPEDFRPERSRSLGLRVALQFTEQLAGTLTFTSENGTLVTLRFPIKEA